MNKLLGHYTNLYSLEKILEKKKLKFGPYNLTNDPFENKDLYFVIVDKKNKDISYDSDTIFCNGQLKAPFKLLCFSVSNDIEFFYKRPRMWSQYTNNHNGCCLILDKNKFDEEFKSLKVTGCKKSKSFVHYNLDKKQNRIIDFCNKLSANGLNNNIDISNLIYKSRKLFLYSKMQDWKMEKEYRYCIYTNNKNDILINICNSIKEIILGENVSAMYQKMLYLWSKENNIPISIIYWENGFPIKCVLDDSWYKTGKDLNLLNDDSNYVWMVKKK